MFGLLRAMGIGGVVPPVIPPAQAPGTGGRRRFVLDNPRKPEKRREPERTKRSIRPVRVALELTAPLPAMFLKVAVAELRPVAATILLSFPQPPRLACTVRVMNPLGLAQERIDELEAVIAAFAED